MMSAQGNNGGQHVDRFTDFTYCFLIIAQKSCFKNVLKLL